MTLTHLLGFFFLIYIFGNEWAFISLPLYSLCFWCSRRAVQHLPILFLKDFKSICLLPNAFDFSYPPFMPPPQFGRHVYPPCAVLILNGTTLWRILGTLVVMTVTMYINPLNTDTLQPFSLNQSPNKNMILRKETIPPFFFGSLLFFAYSNFLRYNESYFCLSKVSLFYLISGQAESGLRVQKHVSFLQFADVSIVFLLRCPLRFEPMWKLLRGERVWEPWPWAMTAHFLSWTLQVRNMTCHTEPFRNAWDRLIASPIVFPCANTFVYGFLPSAESNTSFCFVQSRYTSPWDYKPFWTWHFPLFSFTVHVIMCWMWEKTKVCQVCHI